MPAFYAHDRFGEKVCNRMEGELKSIIEKYYPQFRIGLQGPDIFFFYRLYTKNKITGYGSHMHEVSAYSFFQEGVKKISKIGRDSKEYAYLLGFICHYILDSESHPYVDEMIKKTGVEHMEIEEEFEKKLLRIDQRDPFAYAIADLVPTDDDTVKTIYTFHEIEEKKIKHALVYLKQLKKLFTAPGIIKYQLVNTGLKMTGKYSVLKGVMNQRIDNPKCQTSNIGLLRRFDHAVDVAVNMIYDFDESIQKGKVLHERFDRTYE